LSSRPTSKDSSKSTCLPESGCGASPPALQDGPTIDLFGQPLPPVRRSVRPVKSKPAPSVMGSSLFLMFEELASSYAAYAVVHGLPTSVTSGPRFGGSFETSARHVLWENRLRAQTDELGSTLYELRWKSWPMTLGESIPALRASVPRISASVFIGWPTPTANSPNALRGQGQDPAKRKAGGHTINLQDVATLAGWPTPRTPTGGPESGARKKELGRMESGGGDLQAAVILAGWSTPSSRDWKDSAGMATTGTNPDGSERSRLDQLPRQVNLASWTTPSATDGERGGTITANMTGQTLTQQSQAMLNPLACPVRLTACGATLIGSAAGMHVSGQLSPAHSLWLQLGPFATAWLNCAERVTRSTLRKLPVSSAP
jgi:hypothetical protein